VGKTVILKHLVRRLLDGGVPAVAILYASLATPLYSRGSLESLVRLFVEQHQHPATGQYWIRSDEVQYLKDWEVHLKSLVDTCPHIRFTARGSAAAALRMKIRGSGAGRFTEFVLPPLSFAEYLRFAGRDESLISEREDEAGAPRYLATDIDSLNDEFLSYRNFSGFPEAVASAAVRADPVRFLRQDIIDKVLPSLTAAAGAGLARTQRLRPRQPRRRLPCRVGAFQAEYSPMSQSLIVACRGADDFPNGHEFSRHPPVMKVMTVPFPCWTHSGLPAGIARWARGLRSESPSLSRRGREEIRESLARLSR
jgi:hypothetical protein